VHLNDALRYGELQAGATLLARNRIVGLLELLKQLGLIDRGDAGTSVMDRHIERLRAASINLSTSVAVRYSLCLYAVFGSLHGSVRFAVVGATSVIVDLSCDCAVRFRRVFVIQHHCEHSLRLGVQCSVAPSSEAASWPEPPLRIPVINNLPCLVDELRTMIGEIILCQHSNLSS
jgi:hypothetical protein